MAASDLAAGRKVGQNPVPKEITWFLLAQEFGWLPSEIKSEDNKDMQGILTVLSTYNQVRNKEIEKSSKGIKGSRSHR